MCICGATMLQKNFLTKFRILLILDLILNIIRNVYIYIYIYIICIYIICIYIYIYIYIYIFIYVYTLNFISVIILTVNDIFNVFILLRRKAIEFFEEVT